MQRVETAWRKNGDWKARYSKLYSSRRISIPQEEPLGRISFMSNDSAPYASLLIRMRSNRTVGGSSFSGSDVGSPWYFNSEQSGLYEVFMNSGSIRSDDLGENGTMLLNMVRARSREMDEEAQDQTLDLPHDHDDVHDDDTTESCMHGLSMRMTERSVSRSRVSRISTRRDMDIPSILAFTTPTTSAPAQLEIPAFQKAAPQHEELPRWSIRRSVCPVCSQKWKDKSSINNVKSSGLKRNSSSELPSVIAPARLRTSITMAYYPRPTLAVVDEDIGGSHSSLRNTSTTWQFTRARRFRVPKPQLPPPEATAPPIAAAPIARKDLDTRVMRFLTDADIVK